MFERAFGVHVWSIGLCLEVWRLEHLKVVSVDLSVCNP